MLQEHNTGFRRIFQLKLSLIFLLQYILFNLSLFRTSSKTAAEKWSPRKRKKLGTSTLPDLPQHDPYTPSKRQVLLLLGIFGGIPYTSHGAQIIPPPLFLIFLFSCLF